MKKRLLLFYTYIFIVLSEANAISAYPNIIPVLYGSDTIYITLRGDENCKYATDEEGYTLLNSDKGWCYASTDDFGNVAFSDFMLVPKEKRPVQTINFLQSISKGIIPSRVQIPQETDTYNASRSARKPAIGLRKALIILMEFQDTKFSKSSEDFFRLFNENNYHEDGAIGSVNDYYKWSSYGQLDLKSDIFGPYTAHNNMSYYGRNEGVSGNDRNPYELFSEAIDMVAKEINLADYDADGDGYVDNIHIIYAGYGEEAGASSNAIWAHEMTFRTITIQGMKIDRYSCAPELRGNKGGGISRIGPHCHEIGHALGAMDYYDTDYETGGAYQGTGKWDVMASGSWNNEGIAPADFNPYVKIYNFGWTTAQSLKPDTINKIGVSSEKDNIYRVNTGTNNDFFLLENRDGRFFHSAEPGKGLLIFHIGPNLENREYTNTINSTYPQQCYVVCASANYRRPTSSVKSYGDINSEGCPFPGITNNTEFSDNSVPAALTISGNDTDISITNIHFEENDIVFNFGARGIGEDPEDPPIAPDESYLWGEDFEQLRLPTSWVYKDINGTGEFKVTTKLSTNDQPDSPNAANGSGYAIFSVIPRMVIGEYRTSGCISSPRIRLAEGKKYKLSLSARKYNKRKNNSLDKLLVSLICENSKEDTIIWQEVKNQNSWELVSVFLPDSIFDFSIKILCDVDYGSTLFIDHLTISEQDQGTGIDNNSSSALWVYGNDLYIANIKGLMVKVYSPSGICIYSKMSQSDDVISLNLHRGYYVICLDERRIKVYIGDQ